MSASRLAEALPAILFAIGSLLFLIGNLVLVWGALR